MPFTPFHLGVGIAAKAVAPRLISFQVFALTQVAMDIEPGLRMAQGNEVLHGWTHTLVGAVPVAVASAMVWKMLEGRRIWRWTFEPIDASMLWTTAFVGTWSHVLLDALIHRDMASTRSILALEGATPFTHEATEFMCLLMATAGVALLALRYGPSGCMDSCRRMLTNLSQRPGWFRRGPASSGSRSSKP